MTGFVPFHPGGAAAWSRCRDSVGLAGVSNRLNGRHGERLNGTGKREEDVMSAPIDKLLDAVAWEMIPRVAAAQNSGLPFATHSGVLEIAGLKLLVYVLNTGERVFDAKSVAEMLGVEIVVK